MSNITTSKWEAWINLMPVQPTPGGTLHVTGEVNTHSTNFAFLQKAIPQGINAEILLLDLKVERGFVPATNPQQVYYTEGLLQQNQFTGIEILYKGKTIATIKKIPTVE